MNAVSPSLQQINKSWHSFADKYVNLWREYIREWIDRAKVGFIWYYRMLCHSYAQIIYREGYFSSVSTILSISHFHRCLLFISKLESTGRFLFYLLSLGHIISLDIRSICYALYVAMVHVAYGFVV